MFGSLREFISLAEEIGEYSQIEGADWDLEIGVISELLAETPDAPLLLFDRIKGYPPGYRVVSNLAVTARRTALALGLPDVRGMEVVKAMREKIRDVGLIPPVEVETGPVKENIHVGDEVDLYEFPTPRWHELDGGRYIGTGSMTISRDPDEGWVNLGTYRVQIQDRNTATMDIGHDHHGFRMAKKCWAKGQSLPVAVSCGQDPALFFASTSPVPWGVSEYDYAGGFRGKPVEVTRGVVTDLPIPATAEIVLEGEIVPPEVETRLEGPFGEWTGYYAGGARDLPAFKVKAILHRDQPIIQGNPPSRFPAVFTLGRHFQKAAALWNELDRQLPGVKGVWMVEEAAEHSMVVISLTQMYPGHAKQAAMVAAGCAATAYSCAFIIVVDDDIDPSNLSEIMWALGTRTEPETSIDILRGCRSTPLLPTMSDERKASGDFTHSTAVILACKPYHRMKDFSPSVRTSPGLQAEVRAKWKHLFRPKA